MIIKQPTQSFNYKRLIPRLILLLVGLLVLAGIYLGFNKKAATQLQIKTSFEHKKGESFSDNGYLFSDSRLQTTAFAKTGEHAILISSDSSAHAAYLEIENPANLYTHISVWVNINEGNPTPIINVNAKKEKTFSRSFNTFENKGDWSKMECWFIAPEQVETLVLDLEVKGKGAICFDDLEIKFTSTPPQLLTSEFKHEKLNLVIKEEGFRKVRKKRQEALDKGILISNDDDWVDAKLEDGATVLKAKTRLKGDWTDHLGGTKWSFRVKFKKDDTWKRLKTVSFQTPKARNLLYEWVLHQLWEREDILTTRYDFVTMELNGAPKGIYAYEEHFEKQLLEYKSRREGPIVKFHEGAMWETWQKAIKEFGYLPKSLHGNASKFKYAENTTFGENKTMKSPVLAKHFDEANNLLYQYQNKLQPASAIFDIEQLAKYYAICDLMDAHHSIIWHNQRFYYNPVTNKLEPIGYDGNVGMIWFESVFLGQKYFGHPENTKDEIGVFENLSSDTTFVKKYIHFLNEFTKEEYVHTFIEEIRAGGIARQKFLEIEFPNAKFDPGQIKQRAKKIQLALYPMYEHSIIANEQERRNTSKTIIFKNKHGVPLQVVGTGQDTEQMSFKLPQPVVVWNNHGRKKHRYETIDVPLDAKYLFFKPIGLDTLMYSTIHQYTVPKNTTASQEIFAATTLDTSGIYMVKDKWIIFGDGVQTITENIIIPSGYMVVFKEGCQLDFVNGAAFMSQSPVQMNGTDGAPIVITSSDKTAKGFTVLQANGESILNYVVFSNMDTWTYKNWQLTGAVTFYESDVKIDNTIIRANLCEDALNIVRSTFDIKRMTISETFGDGFDADFCQGNIYQSQFLNTGNDGMDFSGSIISIDDCLVDGSGDKGLSAGEQSNLRIDRIQIKNSVLGMAAKDLSYAHIKDIQLENCQQGFAAFRKKPEYGGAAMDIDNCAIKNVTILHKVEKGSQIKIKNKEIIE